MPRDHVIYCVSTAVSPITHMEKTEGNEAVIMRSEIMTDAGRREIPSLTGNMLRSVLARHPAAEYLADRWRLGGAVNKSTLNFLFHGGQIVKGMSTAKQNPRRTAEYYRLFPMGRLLGGCLPDDILPGSLSVDIAKLVCRENTRALSDGRPLLAAFVPDAAAFAQARALLGPALRPAEDFVGDYAYYRRNVEATHPDLAAEAEASGLPEPSVKADDAPAKDDAKVKGNRSIFAGQCVIPGAAFVHRLVAQHVSDLEIGGLLHSMGLWHARGGYVGGSKSRGHGRLATAVHVPTVDDPAALIAGYVAHVEANREEGVAFLRREFEPKAKPEKAKAGKTGEKKSAKANPKELFDATAQNNG